MFKSARIGLSEGLRRGFTSSGGREKAMASAYLIGPARGDRLGDFDRRRSRMGRALVAILVVFAGAAHAAGLCAYRDYMPAYGRFYAASRSLSPSARADAFVTRYAARHPDFYLRSVYGDAAKQRRLAARYFDPDQRPRFPGVPPLADARVLALAKTIGGQFAAEQKRVAKVFPDFRCDTEVEFAPSLLNFDGHPETVDGRNYLLFGVDAIAMLHVPQDMPAFFDHELFHLYQKQVAPKDAPQGDGPAWWSMWAEGLATYVSQRMNPNLDAQHVLWFPGDMVARMATEAPRGARLMLVDIDKTDAEGDRWFAANKSVDGLPQRAGYYYGYLFAKSVGANTPLPELARMKPQEVRTREIAFLQALADGPTANSPLKSSQPPR